MKITVTVPQTADGKDVSYSTRIDRDEAIRVGAERIGAIRVGRHYYYHADETDEVYRLTATELAMLGAGEIDGRGSDYSLWCTMTGTLVTRPSAAVRDALGR